MINMSKDPFKQLKITAPHTLWSEVKTQPTHPKAQDRACSKALAAKVKPTRNNAG